MEYIEQHHWKVIPPASTLVDRYWDLRKTGKRSLRRFISKRFHIPVQKIRDERWSYHVDEEGYLQSIYIPPRIKYSKNLWRVPLLTELGRARGAKQPRPLSSRMSAVTCKGRSDLLKDFHSICIPSVDWLAVNLMGRSGIVDEFSSLKKPKIIKPSFLFMGDDLFIVTDDPAHFTSGPGWMPAEGVVRIPDEEFWTRFEEAKRGGDLVHPKGDGR